MSNLNVALFGACPGTGNQGVTALSWSAIRALRLAGVQRPQVFDYIAGSVETTVAAPEGALPIVREGVLPGRRFWRDAHLGRAEWVARTRVGTSSVVRALEGVDAILDVSGGDSFSDIYGPTRFHQIAAPKRLALALGKPLFLLPQTYGPFDAPKIRDEARRLIAGVCQAWSRDPDSHERLLELGSDVAAPERLRAGTDLAFALWAEPCGAGQLVQSWIEGRATGPSRPLVGLNVSGLLADREAAHGLKGDYFATMRRLVETFLRETDANVVLIPHVHGRTAQEETDLAVARRLVAEIGRAPGAFDLGRVACIDAPLTAPQLKWIIANCDWFAGARMHATIAGLSSLVPTAGLAYSDKARGIFRAAGASASLFDLRALDNHTLIDVLLHHFERRADHAERLGSAVPALRLRAIAQVTEMIGAMPRAVQAAT